MEMFNVVVDEIKDIFEETSIESVNIPKEVYRKKDEINRHSYQHLASVLSLKNHQFFTITALIGKLIVKDKKSITGGTEQFFKYSSRIKSSDEITILKAIAVDDVDNIYILKDYDAMRNIWQEYSYSGFEKLYEWYSDDNIDFNTKLSDTLIEIFNNNKKLINNGD